MYFVVSGASMRRANGRVSRIFVLTGVSRVYLSVCVRVFLCVCVRACVSICVNYAFDSRAEVRNKKKKTRPERILGINHSTC